MAAGSVPGGNMTIMRELSPQTRAAVMERVNGLASSVLSGVDRIATVTFTDEGSAVLALTVVLGGGKAVFADREYPPDQTVGVSISVAAAHAVGNKDELVEDTYGSGEATFERAIPADIRLVSLLEVFLEALVDVGVFTPAGEDDGRLSAFGDVDASGIAPGLLDYLDLSHRQLAELKRRMATSLAASPGDRVLDIGCGAGHEVLGLAEAGGIAVGVDRSAEMTGATARRVAARKDVAVVQADCHALPFATGSFDGCRIERVLQHVESPERVLAEARRVVRPGGGIVVFEPDWESLAFDSAAPSVSEAIATSVATARRQPTIARRLAGLLTGAGFDDVRCWTDTVVWHSLRELEQIIQTAPAIERAVAAGTVSAGDGAAWTAEQKRLSATGEFRAYLDRVVAWIPVTPI